MILPTLESCQKDPFLTMCRNNDLNGYLNPKTGSNKQFLTRRRLDYSCELLLKHLSKDKTLPFGDFASGSGTFGLKMAELGYDVDFVDNEALFFDYIKLKSEISKGLNFCKKDINHYISEKKYPAIFFGEALEHMENPEETLKILRENLLNGGLLVLTTPNGDFVNCNEPQWNEVKDLKERNKKLANTHGNHVCEFGFKELEELIKNAGCGLLEHRLCGSNQISRKSILRRILPKKILWKLDDLWSKKVDENGKKWGRTQIIVAMRFH